jgi:hypothetical protein
MTVRWISGQGWKNPLSDKEALKKSIALTTEAQRKAPFFKFSVLLSPRFVAACDDLLSAE